VVLETAQDAAGNNGGGAESDVSISSDSKSAPVDSNGRSEVTFDSGSAVESASVDGLPATVTRVQTDLLGNSNPVSEEVPVNSVSTYLDISPDTSVSNQVTITVTVPESTVSGVENPTLYHNPSGSSGWEELSTTETPAAGSRVQLTATTDNGLSPFAIAESTSTSGSTGGGSSGGGSGGGSGGAASDGFTVSELTPEDAEVTQGDEITVSATITTDTFLQQTQDVEFRIDGETVATQEVTLSNDDSTTVEFTGINTSELDGEYEHGVFTDDDSQTGTLTVATPDDGTPADEQTTETVTDDAPATEEADDMSTDEPATEAPETTAEDGPGFTAVIALIAVIAVGLLARRRVTQ
jgi:PGF-CTERM protein